jgi:nucleoside-diphosphate-sugar epimerase
VDLICYEVASAEQVVEALRGSQTLLIHCGTIWVHGPATTVPMTEDAPRRPMDAYGRAKAQIEHLLLEESHRGGLRAVVLHPGHITGPGWVPVNPAGNLSLDVFSKLAVGETVCLPNFGLETLHHVHAEDVARSFALALARPDDAVGRAFHVVSANAVTFRGYAEAVAKWFGRDAELSFVPFEQWSKTVSEDDSATTWSHISHSPSASIEKARRLLGYEPRYSSLEAVHQALQCLIAQGELDVAGASLAPLEAAFPEVPPRADGGPVLQSDEGEAPLTGPQSQ